MSLTFENFLTRRGLDQSAGADDVSTPSLGWSEMAERWLLPWYLRQGTRGMQAAGQKWLPQEPAEKQDQWSIRLRRSVLHPAYDDTVRRLTAKPMARQVTTEGELPVELEPMLYDVDGHGHDLSQFAARFLDAGIDRGMVHMLVDFPSVGGTLDLATERRLGVRPRFTMIPAEALFAWRQAEDVNGRPYLAEIRYHEQVTEPAGEWGEQSVDLVHVYQFVTEAQVEAARVAGAEPPLASKTTYRLQGGDHKWARVDERVISYVGVPLLTFYTDQESGFMRCAPPLEGLADLNLAHYQVSSDHRNILNIVGVAVLFRSGVTAEEREAGLVISPRVSLASVNPDAKMGWVEHSGKGIESIERYIRALEERMEVLGLTPMVEQSSAMTATKANIDESKSMTIVQSWVRDLETVLRQGFEIAAKWMRLVISDEFAVRVYNDFGLSPRTASDVEALIKARMAGEISRETFLAELRRRSVLSEDLDIEDEMERVDQEGPKLGTLTALPPGAEPDEEEIDEEDDAA